MSDPKSKTRTVADLRREADELIARNEMPPFEEALKTIAEAKKVYRAKVRFERLKRARVVQ
jgi:hypothetical protein